MPLYLQPMGASSVKGSLASTRDRSMLSPVGTLVLSCYTVAYLGDTSVGGSERRMEAKETRL